MHQHCRTPPGVPPCPRLCGHLVPFQPTDPCVAFSCLWKLRASRRFIAGLPPPSARGALGCPWPRPPACSLEPLAQPIDPHIIRVTLDQDAHATQPFGLLGDRGMWPKNSRARDPRDDLPPLHSITSSARSNMEV